MTHLLISGPPGTGKCKLLEEVSSDFEQVVWVTTLSSAEFVRKKLGRDDVWIIDTFTWGKKRGSSERDVVVFNPLNLNEVSLAINRVLDTVGEGYVLIMNSISGLLIYHSYQRLLQLLRATLVRVEADKSHSMFSLVKHAHEKSVEVSISMFFPNIIETHEDTIRVIKSSIPLEKNEFEKGLAKDIIKSMLIESL
ncbi:hypothetical protein [Archaeoglobus neptunius]|uniref:hypothetical protein n=1 Tax=Archaeoglobus neptunius TaxID=2798580 RepID=UPI001927A4BC|nr:hypothetical protein [Archaeoglobus neptunius]